MEKEAKNNQATTSAKKLFIYSFKSPSNVLCKGSLLSSATLVREREREGVCVCVSGKESVKFTAF